MVSEGSDQRVVELLSEILRWTKIGALNLKDSLSQELRTDQQRLAYELSDGNRSSTEIAKLTGVSQANVSRWWQRWRELGFVDSSPQYQGRVQRLCSLRMVGIPIPEVPNGNGSDNGQSRKGRRRSAPVKGEGGEPADKAPESSGQG